MVRRRNGPVLVLAPAITVVSSIDFNVFKKSKPIIQMSTTNTTPWCRLHRVAHLDAIKLGI